MAVLESIRLLRERLVEVAKAPEEAAAIAGPRIEAKLIADATTKRGNVPSFGAMGDVPISVRVEGAAIHVSAPDWVHAKARDRGQVDDWAQIAQDAALEVLDR